MKTALAVSTASFALSLLLLAAPAAVRADTVYVANTSNSTIEEFTPGGIGSVFASTGLRFPYALAFDSSGNLYASNYGNNSIEEFTPGGVASVFASTGLAGPSFIAIQVPEPSTWALVGLGLSALIAFRRPRA